jgi:hypothetical protein
LYALPAGSACFASDVTRRRLEDAAKDRDSRVGVASVLQFKLLSTAGHEIPGRKLGGPPPKATYTHQPIAHSTVRER